MRLAGTCSRYSKSAIPQLANAATYHGRDDKLRRWAYQANVMKTFEAMRRQTVTRIVRIAADGNAGALVQFVVFHHQERQRELILGDGENAASNPFIRADAEISSASRRQSCS